MNIFNIIISDYIESKYSIQNSSFYSIKLQFLSINDFHIGIIDLILVKLMVTDLSLFDYLR